MPAGMGGGGPTTDPSYMPSFDLSGTGGGGAPPQPHHQPGAQPRGMTLAPGHVSPSQMSQLGFNQEPPGRKRSGGGYNNMMQGAGAGMQQGMSGGGGQGGGGGPRYLDMSSDTVSDGLPVF